MPLTDGRARHGRGRAAGCRADPGRQGHLVRAEVLQPDLASVYSDETVVARLATMLDGRAGLPDHVGQRVRGAYAGRGARPDRRPSSSLAHRMWATPTACSCSARRRRSPSRARGWRSSARHRRTSRGWPSPASVATVRSLCDLYLLQRFTIRWRVWLTHRLPRRLARGGYAYYRGSAERSTPIDNPGPTHPAGRRRRHHRERGNPTPRRTGSGNTLLFGAVESVLSVASFGVIMWQLSGPLTVRDVTLPRGSCSGS